MFTVAVWEYEDTSVAIILMLGYLDIGKGIVVGRRMLRRKKGSSGGIPRSFIDSWVSYT